MNEESVRDPKPPRFGASDAVAVVGLGALAYGCWLAWTPLGFIVPGALLIAAAFMGARR